MKAFHSDPKIKKKYLARVRAHAKADEIIKGKYWENGKGCAVGCTIHSGLHSAYENELGIPRVLARLEDGIFEALPIDLAKTWPLRFLKAAKSGADLSQVWPKFAIWLLIDPINGAIRFAKTERMSKAINAVANLYIRSLDGGVTIEEWRDAAYAAYAASYAATGRVNVTVAQSEKLLELMKDAK